MGGIANTVGGIFGQTAQAFTPQNQYQYQTGGQDLNSLLAGTQAQTAQNTANQNSLGQTLLAQSQGQGPNPAQQQLQQALTQNQQNAAGQVASQKGINPGLAQKQIATTSANQAQQAAGQGALMGAQQQIAAQTQLGSLYNNMDKNNLTNQGQYESLLNNQNTINSGVSSANTAADQSTMSGLLSGFGGGASKLGSSLGGGAAGGGSTAAGGLSAGGGDDLAMAAMASHGGMIPNMHQMILSAAGHSQGLHPGHPVMMALKAHGGPVPGQQVVPGDSPKNDIVPAMLSAGEGVLPKSIMQAPDAGDKAKSFVEQIKSKTKSGEGGYAKVLAAKRKAIK